MFCDNTWSMRPSLERAWEPWTALSENIAQKQSWLGALEKTAAVYMDRGSAWGRGSRGGLASLSILCLGAWAASWHLQFLPCAVAITRVKYQEEGLPIA